MGDPLIFEELEEFGHYRVHFSPPMLKELLAQGFTDEQIKAYLEDILSKTAENALKQLDKNTSVLEFVLQKRWCNDKPK